MTAPSGKAIRTSRREGFSLVEVILAVGVVAFSLAAVIGLYVVGLRTNREALDTIEAAHMAGRILAERMILPITDPIVGTTDGILPTLNQRTTSLNNVTSIFDGLPISATSTPLYLTQEGRVVPASDVSSYYRLDYIIDAITNTNTVPAAPVATFKGLSRIYLSLSWPGNSAHPIGRYELVTCKRID